MLDDYVEKYLNQLTAAYASIQSIWLFGSRANSTQGPDSDWDFLVFGTQELLDNLRSAEPFHRGNIDLFIVYNGNDFTTPWEDKKKSGSLIDWQWKESLNNKATYRATKGTLIGDGEKELIVNVSQCDAIRVYP